MLKCRIGLLLSAVLFPFALAVFAQNQIGQSFELERARPTVSARDLAVPPAAAKEYKRGVQACDNAKWPAAIEHFRKAIADYQNYPSAFTAFWELPVLS